MDAQHFDSLTRLFARSSRRQTLRLLSGLGLAVMLDHEQSAAKRKKKRKKKRRVSIPPLPPAPPSCTASCERKICGDNGCGGSCGTCGGGQVCADGTCASSCPDGQRLCADPLNPQCVPFGQCCTDADCLMGQTCCGRTCRDLQTDLRNCGACGYRCWLNERCAGGECRCGLRPSPCPPGYSCCATDGECRCLPSFNFYDPVACREVETCPGNSLSCVGTTNLCSAGGMEVPSRVCCPVATSFCDDGRCRLL